MLIDVLERDERHQAFAFTLSLSLDLCLSQRDVSLVKYRAGEAQLTLECYQLFYECVCV